MQDHGEQSPMVLGIVLSRTQANKQERYVKMAYKTKSLCMQLLWKKTTFAIVLFYEIREKY